MFGLELLAFDLCWRTVNAVRSSVKARRRGYGTLLAISALRPAVLVVRIAADTDSARLMVSAV
jgi:hypothetical protein